METLPQSVAAAIGSFHPWVAVGVFFAYVLVDAMYAYYTLAVAQAKAGRAATVGAFMHFLIALGVLSYVENYLYIVPIALGSWVGTYIVVRREEKRRLVDSQTI